MTQEQKAAQEAIHIPIFLHRTIPIRALRL